MERNLEEALEQTDDIIEVSSLQQQPPPVTPTSSGEKSLQEKLYEIYMEECKKEPEAEGLQNNVNLLEKLMKREALPCLVVNLYAENQGYSLLLKDKDGALIEPVSVPYVGQKLLEYLDAEQLPSFLIDALEKSPVNVFHHGCVIAEIRDFRPFSTGYPPGEPGEDPTASSTESAVSSTVSSPAYQTRHILLRPTMQSLVSDVESITSDNRQWTQEEKLELESQMILATAEPLCLEPSVSVTSTGNTLLFNEQKMNTDPMRECLSSPEQPLELEEEKNICTTPPDVATMIACRKRAEIKPGDQYDLKIAEAGKCVDTWKQRPCELVAPSQVDVQKYAKGKQSVPHDDSASTSWPAPEVKCGDVCDSKEVSQSWVAKSNVTESLSDPFFSPEIEPPTEGPCDSQMCLPQVAPSDCPLASVAGAKIESGEAMGVCQGSVPSQAVCLGKNLQGSTDSICLGQPSPGSDAKSHSVTSSVSEVGDKTPAPLLTLPSTSGRSSSAIRPPLVLVRGRKILRFSPYSTSASLAQQTFWGMSGVNNPPPAVQPSASSSESRPATHGTSSATGQNVTNVFGLTQGAPVLKSILTQVQSFPTSAPGSTETSSRGFLPPRGQMPSTQTRAPQCSVQTSVKVFVKNTSGPVTVRLSPSSVILHPESQSQGPQQPPQQPQQQAQQQPQSRLYPQPERQRPQQPDSLYVFISKRHQPPRAPIPPQPIPLPYQYNQRSSFQQWVVPTQQTGLFNLAEARRVHQSQATVVCRVGSTQSPGQNLPSQSIQNPAAGVEQLQARGQNVHLRFVPRIVAVSRAATQRSHQGHTGSQDTGGQDTGTGKGGPPTTPKS
ncbi:transcription factor SPT20 homolog [Cricetulus griseus]|uniref:transcription factor SPT20 homolog n=1 Tax=Cricetulus griseus TaxID=10029 RepID=UPI00022F526E|nr:transcription factor SPT20 homolog [Cricetulus griseus]